MDELAVLTSEKVVITYEIAGLDSRIKAQLIDTLLFSVSFYALVLLVGVVAGEMAGGSVFTIFAKVGSPLMYLGYFFVQEWLCNGMTVGKRNQGLRVVMFDGAPITFGAAIGRNMLRVADFLPMFYFAGTVALLTSPNSQRFGDMIASTVVVKTKRTIPTFEIPPHVGGIHPLEEHVGDLRGMTHEQYTALRRFCDRFPELPTTVQERLIATVWNPIADSLHVLPVPNVHPLFVAEAVVMKYGRAHGLL